MAARIYCWATERDRRGLPAVLEPRPRVIAPSPTPHDLDALAARLAAVEGTQQAQGRELAVIRRELAGEYPGETPGRAS